MRFGLIGERLEHSYSKLIHEKFGRYRYELIPLAPYELAEFLTGDDWKGLNVTIPYKQTVIPYCDQLTEQAERIGSVNTLLRQNDGSILGDNTDYAGFRTQARTIGMHFRGKKVLILGSGGTSLTVRAVVEDDGGRPVVISRSGADHYGNLQRHADADVLINTTPVGMFPDTDARPVDVSLFPDCQAVLDVIYNPFYSRLVLQAKALGIPFIGGLTMLVGQAMSAAERFTGLSLPEGLMAGLCEDVMSDLGNLVLIGMPGCGKTTVGKELAAQLGMDFADMDEEIEAASGMTVPDIFEQWGEDAFREMEREQSQILGKKNRLVIATGGGVVKDPSNYERLKQNALIILLKRDVRLLSIKGRPLTRDRQQLMQLYRERRDAYESFADIRVSANNPIPDVVASIRERIGK